MMEGTAKEGTKRRTKDATRHYSVPKMQHKITKVTKEESTERKRFSSVAKEKQKEATRKKPPRSKSTPGTPKGSVSPRKIQIVEKSKNEVVFTHSESILPLLSPRYSFLTYSEDRELDKPKTTRSTYKYRSRRHETESSDSVSQSTSTASTDKLQYDDYHNQSPYSPTAALFDISETSPQVRNGTKVLPKSPFSKPPLKRVPEQIHKLHIPGHSSDSEPSATGDSESSNTTHETFVPVSLQTQVHTRVYYRPPTPPNASLCESPPKQHKSSPTPANQKIEFSKLGTPKPIPKLPNRPRHSSHGSPLRTSATRSGSTPHPPVHHTYSPLSLNFRDAYSDDYNSEDTEKIEIKKLEVEEEPLDPKIAEAIFCFNKKWKTGISLLESEGIITQDKKSIANFLFKYNDKLSKSELGEILAGKDDNVELLIEFTELLNFTGVSFAEGLRSYLTKFLLPGEAQKISRMMEVFAGKYLKDNPTTFPDTDCAFILAFALIMLNTDAHNPAILEKDKMTKAQFVQNSRGTWHGNDPPQELLEMLYDEIVGNEIQMKTKGDPDKKGWVKSIKGSLFEQNKRWLCLIGNELRWYKNPTRGRPEDPEKPLGYIKLEYVMVNEMDDRFCISSTLPKNIEFYVYEEKKPVPVTTLQFEITCESAAQVEHWAAAVRKNVTFEVEPEFDPKHYKKPKSKAKNFKKTKKF